MLVFRLHKNGTGPYMNKDTDRDFRFPYELEYFDHYLPDGSERNQHPDADKGSELQKFMFDRNFQLDDYVFGFACKKDFHVWFSPVRLGYLHANGFEISAYEVSEELVVKGNRQVCFRVNDAISTKKLNLREFRRIA